MKKITLFILLFNFMAISDMYAQLKLHYFIAPNEAKVLTGESIEIKVMLVDLNDSTHKPVLAQGKEKWYENGDGLHPNLTVIDMSYLKALYKAPDKVPAQNPVAISVEIPDAEGEGKVMLVANITVEESDNSFTLDGPFYSNEKFSITTAKNIGNVMGYNIINAYAVYDKSKNLMTIGASWQTPENKPVTLGLYITGGTHTGTYAWVLNTIGAGVTAPSNGGPVFSCGSTDCQPHGPDCKEVTLEGTITITEFAEIGGYIKGSFSGKLMTGDLSGNIYYENVKGKFKVIRNTDIN